MNRIPPSPPPTSPPSFPPPPPTPPLGLFFGLLADLPVYPGRGEIRRRVRHERPRDDGHEGCGRRVQGKGRPLRIHELRRGVPQVGAHAPPRGEEQKVQKKKKIVREKK